MRLRELLSDLKEAKDLINKVLYALSNGKIGNDLFERIKGDLSEEKISTVLHHLIWSNLSKGELLRYLGAFRSDLSKAKLKLSKLISNKVGTNEITSDKWDELLNLMDDVDRVFVKHILFISSGLLPFDATIENEHASNYKSFGDDAKLDRKLEKAKSSQKIATLLSVKQLGFWIRLQKEHGILDGENIALIVRQFAMHYSSKRSGNVSEQSLYNEYFDTTQVDAAVIRAILKSMMHYIDKEFFS